MNIAVRAGTDDGGEKLMVASGYDCQRAVGWNKTFARERTNRRHIHAE